MRKFSRNRKQLARYILFGYGLGIGPCVGGIVSQNLNDLNLTVKECFLIYDCQIR